MSDFTLTPDEGEEDTPTRPLRGVATGLAPTADLPTRRRTREHPPCEAPCEACGTQVLTGLTASGQRMAVDTSRSRLRTFVVIWENGAPVPRMVESQGYPEHRCGRPS